MNVAKIRGLMRLYWSGDFTLETNVVRIVYAAMHPHMHPDCCPIEQDAIQQRLDGWYALDGRHNHDHPMHALYTGLAEKYAEQGAAE